MNSITLTTPEIVIAITALIWLIRLEAAVLYQSRDHIKLSEAVKEKDKLLWEKFDAMRTDIGKILENLFHLKGQMAQRGEPNEKTF